MGAPAEDLYQSLGVFARKDESGDLLKFVEAQALGIEKVYEIVRDREDGRPGWAVLYDVEEVDAEHLPYTAQYVGARLTPEMDTAQQRNEVAAPSTWRRGQTETLKTAIRRTLTGTKYVVIKERTPEAHSLYVRVLASEASTPARTEAVAKGNKVAGLLMDFALFTDFTLDDLEAKYETVADAEAAYEALDDAITDTP